MAARLTMESVALGLGRSGFHVFPLRPGSKQPATRDGLKAATRDPARIRGWWHAYPDLNVGIHCGRSRVAVVDCDAGKPWPLDGQPPEGVTDGADMLAALLDSDPAARDVLWSTAAVLTPSNGWHFYFRVPEGAEVRNSAGKVAPWIDVRSGEGYVVGPYSTVAGRHYRPAGGWSAVIDAKASASGDDIVPNGPASLTSITADILPMPAPILDRARTTAAPPVDPIDAVLAALRQPRVAGSYGEAALAREVERVRTAREGTRNHTINRAAFSLGQLVAAGLLDEQRVVDELVAAGRAIGLEERELIGPGNRWGTIGSGLTAGKRSPREVGGIAG